MAFEMEPARGYDTGFNNSLFLLVSGTEEDVEESGLPVDFESGNTTGMNESELFEDDIHKGPEWFVVPLLFGVIFFVGVMGNGTLIYTVLMNRKMRNTPNVLLVSLALGDLLLILISVPFSSTIYTFDEWPYGEAICKFNEFLGALSLGVSVFTLTALSGERYMVIVHPMSNYRGSSVVHTIVLAACIWILSMCLAVIELFAAHVHYDLDQGSHHVATCDIHPAEWGDWYGQFHSMFQFVVYFALPIIIIATFYALMARMLMQSSKNIPGDGIKGQAVKQMEARKKVAKLVLSFVFVFAACWLPRHIYSLWYYYDPNEYTMFWHIFKIAGFCLSFINSCVNPLALYFLSNQFRTYYHRYMFCWCTGVRCGRRGGSNPDDPDYGTGLTLLQQQQQSRKTSASMTVLTTTILHAEPK